jgi:transcriptional regulator with XRE-family HTH domain
MRNANCEIAAMGLDSPHQRLRWARQQHGQYVTPTDAARAFGWKTSTYLGHENGDRNPSRAAAKRYARAYRVRWEWLLDKEGSPTIARSSAKIIGEIGPGAKVHLYDDSKSLELSETPPGTVASTSALEVLGGSMRGIADSGWLVFFDDDRRPPGAELIGKLCILELKSGDILVRTLQPGRKRARYDLESTTEPTLRDQQVIWAARITWIKPR